MIKWEIREQDEQIVESLKACGIDDILARLLANRGCQCPKDAEEFISPSEISLFPPDSLPDMASAAEKIRRAIELGKKIVVYGDYDVDGVTSSAVLLSFLKSIGANVGYYIPDRKDEGYGLSEASIDKIYGSGVEFIITVDNGTTAVSEIEYIKSLGMDIVVTDHHECSDSLPRCPVVNPKRTDSEYPFKELAGVGVVFKLVSYLSREDEETLFSRYGALVAVGTIADVMPLVSENRRIVFEGLKSIRRNCPVGLSSLFEAAGSKVSEVDSGTVSFRLAPRLNAAGRMGNASDALKLLLCEDKAEAEAIAKKLCLANDERQKAEREIFASVEKRLKNAPKHNIIIEGDEKWHGGVIGIVASRLTEKYGRPVILFSFDGDNAKGSARSVLGVNIHEIIASAEPFLLKFGGHEMAAGLTVKRSEFDEFRNFMYDYADNNIERSLLVRSVITECLLPHNRLNLNFYDDLTALEPFGSANPTPVFTVKGLEIMRISGLSQGKHCKFSFRKEDGSLFDAMFFSHSPLVLSCKEGDVVDIACVLGKNTFRGKTGLSVIVKAMRLDSSSEEKISFSVRDYDDLISGEATLSGLKITKDDVAVVYRFLRSAGKERFVISPFGVSRRIFVGGESIGYVKLRLCLNILKELFLIDCFDVFENGVSEETAVLAEVFSFKGKTSLEKSETFRKYS